MKCLNELNLSSSLIHLVIYIILFICVLPSRTTKYKWAFCFNFLVYKKMIFIDTIFLIPFSKFHQSIDNFFIEKNFISHIFLLGLSQIDQNLLVLHFRLYIFYHKSQKQLSLLIPHPLKHCNFFLQISSFSNDVSFPHFIALLISSYHILSYYHEEIVY